jgi:hypothetical protein
MLSAYPRLYGSLEWTLGDLSWSFTDWAKLSRKLNMLHPELVNRQWKTSGSATIKNPKY